MATYICSAIISKVSGKSVLKFLTPCLFEPLGIEIPSWESDPGGINVGGWGLSVTTEDISKLDLLNQLLKDLAIGTVQGEKSAPLANELSGRTYSIEKNDRGISAISFNFDGTSPEISIVSDQGEYAFSTAYGKTVKGSYAIPHLVSQKVAVSGAWEADDTYAVKIIYYETPQSMKYTFRFEDDTLY